MDQTRRSFKLLCLLAAAAALLSEQVYGVSPRFVASRMSDCRHRIQPHSTASISPLAGFEGGAGTVSISVSQQSQTPSTAAPASQQATTTSPLVTGNVNAATGTKNSPLSSSSTPLVELSSSTQVAATSQVLSVNVLTPNGIKAGIAGGDAYLFVQNHIGWWYDWTPAPKKSGTPLGIPMLWGGGKADATDAMRLAQFKQINKKDPPKFVLGFEEPDCPSGEGSAGMSVSEGVSVWNKLVAPLGKAGSILGSPSMCKQADETWLAQFKEQGMSWDITAIHVNKNNIAGVKEDINHYWNTYGKPIWVTEFACVDDKNGFTPCTDQNEIDEFINEFVPLMEQDRRVFGYAYSNGEGLGDVWPMMKDGALSPSGKTYLSAIAKYH